MFYLQPDTALRFPPVERADETGLLCIGGDLRPERLLLAYEKGIFPWYSEEYPILWFSPDPRAVLPPDALRVSRSLRRRLRREHFAVTWDQAFEQIIRACAQQVRPRQEGTWITDDMESAYTELHKLGYAHSVEVWRDGELAGGLYGVSLGAAFFGESMTHVQPDASKVALVHLVQRVSAWGFELIDCQMLTPHLRSLGATEIPRADFLEQLTKALRVPSRKGSWALESLSSKHRSRE